MTTVGPSAQLRLIGLVQRSSLLSLTVTTDGPTCSDERSPAEEADGVSVGRHCSHVQEVGRRPPERTPPQMRHTATLAAVAAGSGSGFAGALLLSVGPSRSLAAAALAASIAVAGRLYAAFQQL